MNPTDPRLPVLLRARLDPTELAPDDVVLLDAGLAHPALPVGAVSRQVAFTPAGAAHGTACACCGGQTALGRVLLRLLVERARGEIPFFRRLVAVADMQGRASLLAALRSDPIVGSRYAPAPPPSSPPIPLPGSGPASGWPGAPSGAGSPASPSPSGSGSP